MRTLFSLWFISLLVWSSLGDAKAAGETVINQFPYVLTKNAPGWTLNSATWGSGSDEFLISAPNYATVNSPRIDIPAAGALLTIKSNMEVHSSEDGINYVYLKPTHISGISSCILSSKVKYLQFKSYGTITSLSIEKFSDEMHWDVTGDGCTLTGTVASEGSMSYCWFTEAMIPATDYELGRQDFKTKVLFDVSSSDPENTTLYLMEKSPLSQEAITVFPIRTTNGRNRYQIEERFINNKVSFGIKAVSKGGTVPTIKIEHFRVEKNLSPHFQPNLSQWYDTNRNGNMSFFNGNTGGRNESGKYNVKDGVIVLDETFPQDILLSPCNINNDGALDYLEQIYAGGETQAFFDYRIYTNSEGKETLISPLFNSRFYYDTSGNYRESFTPCDYNSDGLTDFLLVNDRVAIQCIDGAFMIRQLEVLTQKEYQDKSKDESWNQNIPSRFVTSTRGDAFLKQSDMFVGSSSGSSKAMGQQVTDIDFNKDGRPDLLNITTGRLLLNIGEDKYVAIPLGGNLYFRDLNGDQRMDYIVYEPTTKTVTSHVYQADGTEKIQTLISNLSMDQQMWCYDFDKDGDVDILLPFSYQKSNGASFLLIMENDGTGKFKKHESYFDEKLKFVACVDIDHDGYYDVVAHDTDIPSSIDGQPNEVPFLIHLLKGDAKMQFALQKKPLFNIQGEGCINLNDGNIHYGPNYGAQVADINNDGVYEILATCVFSGFGDNNGTDIINEALHLSGISPNQAPQKPAKPSYSFEPSTGYLKISWQQGKDAESSPVDLTYALRIGTQPGKGDIFYAHAKEDGTRLNLLDGNMGYNLDKLLNASNWNAGKYYIAIQAIDPMHKGSAWSEEAIFDKTQLIADFHLSDERTVADTLTLTLTAPAQSSLTYNWNLDGATVISVNKDKSIYKIQFTLPGEKHISLQTTDAQGKVSDVKDKSIFIFGNRFKEKVLSMLPEKPSYITCAMDMDNDGLPELLTSNGVYESDGKGKFSKIKKIYNTNISFETRYVGDYLLITDANKDGLSDALFYSYTEGQGRSLKQYINSGNKELTLETKAINKEYTPQGYITDFDHDGYFDFIVRKSFYINSGNNLDFDVIVADGEEVYTEYQPCDINNDGFTDAIYNYIIKGTIKQYLNNGDRTFTKKEIPSTFANDLRISTVADMNNDGYPDLVIQKNSNTILIVVNNKNENFNEIKEITFPATDKERSVCKVADFDNNGFPDIEVSNAYGSYNKTSTVYLYDDWKYEIYNSTEEAIYSNKLALDLNNDGKLDYTNTNTYWGPNMNHTTLTNTRPEAPQALRGVQQDDFIVLKWEAAKDAETPYAQMRYNISVKKQGATGEGAYIISPMNDLNANSAVIPTYNYPTSTTYAVPLSIMPAGMYEVQVQAIDGQNTTSPFTEPYLLKVEAAPKIKLPVAVCATQSATILYKGNTGASTPTWNWDGGTLLDQKDNSYEVVWNTEGTKQLSVTVDGVTSTATLTVSPAIDPTFNVHPFALVNAENKLTLPQGNFEYKWEYSKNGDKFLPVGGVIDNMGVTHASPISISRRGDTGEAKIIFKMKGEYILRLNVTAACGTLTCEKNVSVSDELQKQEIALVTADAQTGKYRIGWAFPKNLPSFVTGVNVYKEGNKYNDFRLLATVPVTENSYVDVTSNPQITSSRYRLTLLTSYGAETTPSTPAKGVHTMINKGIGNSWNLIWSQYEGAVIESYRILRGTTPDNLVKIGEVSGSATSYSDVNVPQGMLYYALEFDTKYDGDWQPMSRSVKGSDKTPVRSNVISIANASDAIFPTHILIQSIEETKGLSAEQQVMHLSATIYPLQATFRTVNWTLVAGDDLAYINQDGVLTGIGNGKEGTVTVRATTIDGSGISAEITIPVSAFTIVGIEENTVSDLNKWLIYFSSATNELHISGIPESTNGAVICIFNMAGQFVYQEKVHTTEAIIPFGEYPSGIYGVKVISENGTISQKFIKSK